MSGQLTIKQSLNKAFRKIRPTRDEIDRLKNELVKMLDNAKPNETEAFHKGLVTEFLTRNAFADYFINSKGNTDLVIHIGKGSASNAGVIIETKRPANKIGMPTVDNLNKKAMQELLLYYLRERFTNENKEIKHLVITNLYEWFIFDAHEFVRFADDTKLKKLFLDFESGRLSSAKTDFFYKEIASPAIKKINDKIKFTYFDIRNYKSCLKKQGKTGDNKLIELQKVFSPIHLLKLPSANDSNTLNKDFYNELLHIIGLEEQIEGGKRLIQRKTKEHCDKDSLIEATIAKISSVGKYTWVKNAEQFGENKDDQLCNMALELVITWINRILFLKLLESQIVGYHQGSKEYLFLNSEKIKEYDDLETLFFDVLAQEPKNREKSIDKKFPKVPYLNSSLFEPTELEHQTILISNLPDDTNLPLYRKTVVKTNSKTMRTLDYLLKFLDAYDFASEGNEDIVEAKETLINASVLGLIFEKINGYKDGSFFTPGFITEYICRETIRCAVVQKYKENLNFKGNDINDLKNYIKRKYQVDHIKKYNEIINSLKICDPAVGSGHFLVSALNEIIAIKSEIGILADENGILVDNYHVEVHNDELMIFDKNKEFFKYNPKDRESQRVQKTLFHEKEVIIENCLFGVDINQNSVNICRLRLWIELLKNAYYKEDGQLETLPNIDINIKRGNSLISRQPLKSDLKEVLRESKFSIEAYKIAVNTYRNAKNKEQKQSMTKLINKIKKTFTEGIDKNHPKRKKLSKLRGKLFALINQRELFQTESNKSKRKKIDKLTKETKKLDAEITELENGVIYRDAFEWRLEFPEVLDKYGKFVGFDLVIGNPPYIDSEGMVNSGQRDIRELISATYTMTQGNWDIYIAFFERGFNILGDSGLLAFITPDKWISKSFGNELRTQAFKDIYSVLEAGRDVFESAKVDSIVSIFNKNKPNSRLKVYETRNSKMFLKKEVDKSLLAPPFAFDFVFSNHLDTLVNIEKTFGKLSDIMECENACATSDTYKLKPFIKDLSENEKFNPTKQLKIINTGTIDKYTSKWGYKVMTYLGEKPLRPVVNKKEFLEAFPNTYGKKAIKSKLIIKGLTLLDGCLDTNGNTIPGKSTLIITSNSIERLKFISAILNSKFSIFYIKEKYPASSYNQGINFTKDMINNLPAPNISAKKQKPFIGLVDKILTAKKNDPQADTSKLEEKIDEMVYKLYKLTDEEKNIIKEN